MDGMKPGQWKHSLDRSPQMGKGHHPGCDSVWKGGGETSGAALGRVSLASSWSLGAVAKALVGNLIS